MYHGNISFFRSMWPSSKPKKLPQDEIEKALDALCAPPTCGDPGKAVTLPDVTFKHIKNLLTHYDDPIKATEWSQRPRIFTILRNIQRLDVMTEFIACDCLDDMLPFPESDLPLSLGQSRSAFVSMQVFCLTDAIEMEKGEQGKHVQFHNSGDVHFYNMRLLGRGAFGRVDVVWSTLSRKQFARKKFHRSWNIQATREQYGWFAREIAALKRLSHRHLVKIKGTYSDPKCFAFLMEPVAQCNLSVYLTRFRPEQQPTLRYFFGCLANAIAYLHSKKVYHMDIKPGNILVKHDRVYVADFGTAHDWSQRDRSTTWAATPRTVRYMPPEQAKDPNAPKTYAIDIWSLGVVFLEMATVLKGATLQDLEVHMQTHGSRSQFAYNNGVGTAQWLGKLQQSAGPEYDNLPLIWIKDMLAQDPNSRPLARQMYGQICEADVFCDDCCAKGEGWQAVGAFDTDSTRSHEEDSVAEFIDAEEPPNDDVLHQPFLLAPQRLLNIQSWVDRTESNDAEALAEQGQTTELLFDVEADEGDDYARSTNSVEAFADPIPARLSGIDFFADVYAEDQLPQLYNDDQRFDVESNATTSGDNEGSVPFDVESDGDNLTQTDATDSDTEAKAKGPNPGFADNQDATIRQRSNHLNHRDSMYRRSLQYSKLGTLDEEPAETAIDLRRVFDAIGERSPFIPVKEQILTSSIPAQTENIAKPLPDAKPIRPSCEDSSRSVDLKMAYKEGEVCGSNKITEPTRSHPTVPGYLENQTTKTEHASPGSNLKTSPKTNPGANLKMNPKTSPRSNPMISPKSSTNQRTDTNVDPKINGRSNPLDSPKNNARSNPQSNSKSWNRESVPHIASSVPLTAENLKRIPGERPAAQTIHLTSQKRQFWPWQRVSAKRYFERACRPPDDDIAATTQISKRSQKELERVFLVSWMNKSTPLLESYIKKGGAAAVRVLLDAGCNPGTKRDPDCRPLLMAIKGASLRHNKCAAALLQAGADPNARTSQTGRSMLSVAIANQNFPGYRGLLWTLLHWGADPNIKDRGGDYPLLQILHGSFEPLEEHLREALALILASRFPVNVNAAPPGALNLPLHLATRRKDPWAVGMLLEKGAKVQARNAAGQTAFEVAVGTWAFTMTSKHKEVARLLLAHGASAKESIGVLRTPPLFSALRNGHLDLVELLVRYGADPRQKDWRGQNAFEVLVELSGQQKVPQTSANKVKAVLDAHPAVIWSSDSEDDLSDVSNRGPTRPVQKSKQQVKRHPSGTK